MKVGILGGSFNPPHQGHRYISHIACKFLQLDQIWWLVAKCNPFKSKLEMEPIAKRIILAKEITKQDFRIRISDFETTVADYESYFILKKLKMKYNQTSFVWLMGSDNIPRFHQWKNYDSILKLMPIMLLSRNDNFPLATHYPFAIRHKKLRRTHSNLIHKTNWWSLKRIKNKNISSTQLRKKYYLS